MYLTYFLVASVLLSTAVGPWVTYRYFAAGEYSRFFVVWLSFALSAAILLWVFYGLNGALVGFVAPLAAVSWYMFLLDRAVEILPLALVAATLAGCLVSVLVLINSKARWWVLLPATVVAVVTFLITAEILSRQEMCKSAHAFGVTEFARNTFFWSIRNLDLFSGPSHASFVQNDVLYIWSYRQGSFVGMSDGEGAKSSGQIIRC